MDEKTYDSIKGSPEGWCLAPIISRPNERAKVDVPKIPMLLVEKPKQADRAGALTAAPSLEIFVVGTYG